MWECESIIAFVDLGTLWRRSFYTLMTWRHLVPIGCGITCPVTRVLGHIFNHPGDCEVTFAMARARHTFSQPEPRSRRGIREACSPLRSEAWFRLQLRQECQQFTLFAGTLLQNFTSIRAFLTCFYLLRRRPFLVPFLATPTPMDFRVMRHITRSH